MNLVDLTGKKILVTGASSGIGRATSMLLANLGAQVVLCGRDKSRLEETLTRIPERNNSSYICFDINQFANYNDLFSDAVKDGKKLSGLVHCAGIAKVIPIKLISEASINEVFDTNIKSYLMMVSYYSKKKFSEGGAIIGVSALNAHNPQIGMSVYAASKAAVESSTKTMALELIKTGRRINCVIPGPIDTPMIEGERDAVLERISSTTLMSLGRPDDVANMISFLLSDAAGYITGRSFYVDGGSLGQSVKKGENK